jgi:hypothetical protein
VSATPKLFEPVICDFCGSPKPTWEYPAESFLVKMVVESDSIKGNSVGSWLACEDCHRVIETGSREDLVRRAALNPCVKSGIVDAGLAVEVARPMYEQFFASRSGPAVRVARC